MKTFKILLAISITLACQAIQGQKTYYPYTYQNNDGLTDSLSTELVKPEYDYYRIAKNKKLYVFYNDYPSKLPSLCFDTKTEVSDKKYRYISLDDVLINDEFYHYFSDDKKGFLKNADTDAVVKVQEDIYSIENLGSQFILAKFHPKDTDLPKSKSPGNDKNGFPLPPKMIEIRGDFYAIYANMLPLKPLLKIESELFVPLYETNEIDDLYIKNIRKFNSINFAYLIFKRQNNLYLYDKNLKLIKKIAIANTKRKDQIDKDYIVTEVSKALGKEVFSHFNVYPSMPSRQNKDVEKKRDDFELKKSESGLSQLIRTKDEKICFTTPFKATYDEERNLRVSIEQEGDKSSYFHIDKESGIPYLPAKYIDLLQINLRL